MARRRRRMKATACCVCPPQPAPRPRRRRRAPRKKAGAVAAGRGMDPFLHCIYGPVNYVGEGSRCPDGSNEPSVVVEHRAVYTITASSNGNITLALVPSPYGCIGLDEGTVTTTINTSDVSSGSFPFPYTAPTSTTLNFTTQSWNPGSSSIHHHYSLLPYTESLQQAGNLINSATQYGMQASKFRVLSTQAKISYIGNNFYNQGVAATARLALDLDGNFPATAPPSLTNDAYFLQYGDDLPQILPDSFSQIGNLPGSRVFPITQDVNLINPPMRFDYQLMKEAWSPYYSNSVPTSSKDVVFAGMMDNTLTSDPDTGEAVATDGVYGIGYAPVTFFAATGLALAANNPLSITVEARCCVEYTLGFASPSMKFSSLPPPARPLAIQAAHDFGRLLPSSIPSTPATESGGILSKFWEWYYPKEKAAMLASWRVGASIANAISGGAINSLTNSLGRFGLGSSPSRPAIGY